jgi:hypothetical protein
MTTSYNRYSPAQDRYREVAHRATGNEPFGSRTIPSIVVINASRSRKNVDDPGLEGGAGGASPDDARRAMKMQVIRLKRGRMKSILDRSFRYTPSVETDLRKTFARIRRKQHDKQRAQANADAEVKTKVLLIDHLKKASSVTAGAYAKPLEQRSGMELDDVGALQNRGK